MKKLLLSTTFILASAIATTQEKQADIKFETASHDFGNITEGTQATVEFSFTNTGNAPLGIRSVIPACGCIVPNWSKDPIAPGAKGVITAIYNSTDHSGAFTRSITVNSNAKSGSMFLTIKGHVQLPKPKSTDPDQNK